MLSRLSEALDRAPLRVRLGFTALGIGALAYSLGMNPIFFGVGAAAALASIASISSLRLGRLLRHRSVEEEGSIRVFEVEIENDDSARMLAALVDERSRVGRGRYVVASISDAGASRVLVAIFAHSQEDASVEAEVFKTLVAGSVEGVRLNPAPPSSYAPLADLARLGPSRSGGRVVVAPTTRIERGVSSGATDGIRLGVRIDTVLPEDVVLTPEDVRGNIGVFGSTGAGKSTTLSVIASEALRAGFKVYIIDWAGEYEEKIREVDANYVIIDPIRDGGVDPLKAFVDTEEAVSALSSSLDLTEPQEFMLQRVLEKEKPSSLPELVEAVEYLEENSRWDKEVKKGLLRKLGILISGSSVSAFSGTGESFPKHGLVIVDVSRIRVVTARRSFINVLLSFIDNSVEGEKIVIVDEAHNLLPGGDGYLALLMSEARKRGLHFAIATQSPSLLGARVLTNTNVKIVHRITGSRDIEALRDSMYLDKGLVEQLPTLPTGTAVVQAPSMPKPVLVRVKTSKEPGNVTGDLVEAKPVY